ncbi:SDR family oxidoreductase [Candidatus Neomarinimicrobiota bacterium]
MPHRILITGAGGQLATALNRLLEGHYELRSVGEFEAAGPVCDLTDWKQVRETVAAYKPTIIINTAALTNVDLNESEPELAATINTRGVEYLISASEKYGTKLVQISTDYVFDGSAGPYLEVDPTNPINVYGQTKLDGDLLALEHPRNLVVRANVLYGGKDGSAASFVRWVIRSLQAGETIQIVDDQVNNPTLTDHLVQAINAAIDQDGAGLYNYGGLEFIDRYAFACRIAHQFGLPTGLIEPIKTSALKQLAPRPLSSGLICSKMIVDFGVMNYDIEDSLEYGFGLN